MLTNVILNQLIILTKDTNNTAQIIAAGIKTTRHINLQIQFSGTHVPVRPFSLSVFLQDFYILKASFQSTRPRKQNMQATVGNH